jgi:hypothetical protein
VKRSGFLPKAGLVGLMAAGSLYPAFLAQAQSPLPQQGELTLPADKDLERLIKKTFAVEIRILNNLESMPNLDVQEYKGVLSFYCGHMDLAAEAISERFPAILDEHGHKKHFTITLKRIADTLKADTTDEMTFDIDTVPPHELLNAEGESVDSRDLLQGFLEKMLAEEMRRIRSTPGYDPAKARPYPTIQPETMSASFTCSMF